ncbi:MAG: hypothetical protein JJU40_09135 [Rhodobacteraceae bacterium]|nr:hypothetical protein [Paracoccaceae bacterium]
MSQTSPPPVLALLPYGLKPDAGFAHLPLGRLSWPLGRPAGVEGGALGDLGPDDHLLAFLDPWALRRRPEGLHARLSLMLTEPRSFRRHLMRVLEWQAGRFHRLLTFDARMLRLPNARFCTFGATWVRDPHGVDTTKTRALSLIASQKRLLRGHRARHAMARWLVAEGLDADLLGRAYRPIDTKEEGLAPYRFSLVIENSREPGYFTEKLIDALICRTLPIYWGAPDVGDWFLPEGMILCDSVADMKAACRALGPADYAARAEAIEENRRRAMAHLGFEEKAARLVVGE